MKARFSHARFTGRAHFGAAEFTNAYYDSATFAQEARFSATIFDEFADFQHAIFEGTTDFDRTEFRRRGGSHIGVAFCFARFSHPDAVVFNKTWLGNAVLVNTDVTKITLSAVEWRRRKDKRRMLFEEEVDLSAARPLKPSAGTFDERNFILISEVYQQLKKSYDDRRDFSTAGDFHFGEIEMKRQHSDCLNPIGRWFHRCLSLVAWYRYASCYGESYVRPSIWLAAVVVLFTLLFPMPGLIENYHTTGFDASIHLTLCASLVPTAELSYRKFNVFSEKYPKSKLAVRPSTSEIGPYMSAWRTELTAGPQLRVACAMGGQGRARRVHLEP